MNYVAKLKSTKKIIVLCLVLAVIAAMAVGDIERNPITADANNKIEATSGLSEKPQVVSDSNVPGKEPNSTSAIQSITFKKDVEIRDALRFLAAKYQKNIVPSPKVDGLITVTSLYDVTFEEAMNAILGVGFKYEQDGNFIRVYTEEEYKKIKEDKSRMIYKVFTLYYVNSNEVLKLVSPVLSSAGVIKASSAAVAGVSTGQNGSGDFGGDSMALNDAIVVFDYPENIAKAEDVIKRIDVRPQQVLVEATILSATLNEDTELGIDFSSIGGVGVSITTSGVETTGFTNFTPNSGLKIGITADNFAAFIRALETITDITILANPKILALNKQMGTVFIGKKSGYKDQTTISNTGQATVGEIKFLDTGTKLSFRPYIADDGYIRMDIYPKDSTGNVDGTTGLPTETTAELTTNIMLKDGQTVVIGGLFRNSTTAGRSQVPLLGNIPIAGVAFRSTSDKTERQEIIIMLTPHIVTVPQGTNNAIAKEDVDRKHQSAKDELQCVGRASLAENHYAKAAKDYIEGKKDAALCEVNEALLVRPTYLEALRLKEKILSEMFPDITTKVDRLAIKEVEKQDSPQQ